MARRDSNSNNSNTKDLFYLFDRQGSVIATTGSTGAVVHRYSYGPYGQETGADPADDNPWRYASGYSDTATGMTKFGTRYYQPSVMNWTQTDPVPGNLASPMTLNPYAYVGNNPISYIDPTGQSIWGDVLAGAATFGGLALAVAGVVVASPVIVVTGAVVAIAGAGIYVYQMECKYGAGTWWDWGQCGLFG